MKDKQRQIIIIFGASGDLTKRKLLPALYMLDKGGKRAGEFFILGVSRTNYDGNSFRELAERSLKEFVPVSEREENSVKSFIAKIDYVSMDPSDRSQYPILAAKIRELTALWKADNYLYYFSTPPALYKNIPGNLASVELTQEHFGKGYRRVIVEKPFGYDLASAYSINGELRSYFAENQIYRIDHFLGKETVQNILALRFANGIFEPLWNRNYIDRVEITAVENRGIEQRGGYYEGTGAMRDMVQNHLLQLVALCAAEPPVSFNEKDFRDEVVKVYKSIKPFTPAEIEKNVIWGQYTSSQRNGTMVKGYREEVNVDPSSHRNLCGNEAGDSELALAGSPVLYKNR